jgi:DNA-binding MarR family transcriptional regulator
VSALQDRILRLLERCPGRSASVSEIARRLASSRPAVASAGRALERAGRAHVWRQDGEYGALMVALIHA